MIKKRNREIERINKKRKDKGLGNSKETMDEK